MVTVKVIFRKDKTNPLGEHPLYLRITKNRRTRYISLKVYLDEKHWDEKNNRVRKSYKNSQRMNNYLAAKVAEAQAVALDLAVVSKDFLPEAVTDELHGKEPQNFTKYALKYLEELQVKEKVSTYRKVKSILKKVSVYNGKQDLMFDQITVSWLKDFESYLKTDKNNRVNTVGSNYRTIRRIITAAVAEGVIKEEQNAFKRFKFSLEKTSKLFLTEEELKLIEEVELVEGSMKSIHRDMYVFAAYAGGLRISDILLMKWKNFDGERILMETKKTGSTVTIKLPSIAMQILSKYMAPDRTAEDYVFPILACRLEDVGHEKLFAAISSATAYTNDDLKEIAVAAKVDKRISFHTSRHTFATLALKKGMRIEYVSKLMGHSNIGITQVYAKIVNGELDKAMEIFN